MATVINNPDSGASGMVSLIVGVVLILALVAVFAIYGLPLLRNTSNQGTTVNVPDKIQVDVKSNQ